MQRLTIEQASIITARTGVLSGFLAICAEAVAS